MPIFMRAQHSPLTNRLSGPMFAAPLLSGDAGVAQTVAKMRQLVDQALRDPQIIRLAKDIVRSVPAHDEIGEVNTIYQWVLSNIRFTKDPVNKETLYPPSELLKIQSGDCDDISMLMGTLLLAVGYPARLITVSANDTDPQQFSHVYVETQVSGSWIPMDAARPEAMFGEEPPMYYRKRAWSLTDDSYQDLNGLGGTMNGTKIFAHPGSNVHVHDGIPRATALGNYPRYRSLGAGRVRTMGDGSSVTSALIATIPQDINSIAAAVNGPQPLYPYASYQTAYTPGALVPPGGYSATVAASGENVGLLLALGLGLALMFMSR
jgi:hypothetical protein